MQRRQVLQYLGGSIVSLSGCAKLSLDTPQADGDGPEGCDQMQKMTVDTEEASLTDDQLSHLYPIHYADLQSDTRQIVETASGEGRYEVCPPKPDALKSLIDEVEKRIDRQWNDYGGEPENRPEYLRTAYLHRDGSYFALEVTVEDLILSG